MKSVYISGPLTADTLEERLLNIHRAALLSLHYMKKGWAVYTPHLQSDYLDRKFDHGFGYEKWLENDFYWIEKCDRVAFLPNWETSKGARMEMAAARAAGKEILIHGILPEEE